MVEKKEKNFSSENKTWHSRENDAIKASSALSEKLIKDPNFDRRTFAGFGVGQFKENENSFFAAIVYLSYRPEDIIVSKLPSSIAVMRSKKKIIDVPVIYSISGEFQIEDSVSVVDF